MIARAVLALVALASPAFAEGGPSAESVARLVQAIQVAGCVVTEVNQGTVLKEAEMDETEAGVIVSMLIDDGKAVFVDNGLHLKTGTCAG